MSPTVGWAEPSLLGHSSLFPSGLLQALSAGSHHAACRPTAIAGGESDLGELGDCLSGSFKESLRWARHASAVT